MHLAVIIPALNESATIGSVIDRVRATDMPSAILQTSVVVVDDGSDDDTGAVAGDRGCVVVSHGYNRGLGVAFRSGIDRALRVGADLIVNIDADGQFDPGDIPALLTPLLDGTADFATASRFKDRAMTPEMPAVKLWGNHRMSWLVSLIVGHRFYDVSCGFRAYTRDAALHLNLWGDFTYTQETFLDLSVKGMRIVEVPTHVRGVREVGKSRVASDIITYARRTSGILFHAFRDYWPMRFFGSLAGLCAAPGCGLIGFLAQHYVVNRSFAPHIWAGFVGGGFLVVSLVCLLAGLLGSMLAQIRLNEEEVLYFLRRDAYGAPPIAAVSDADEPVS
jgi:glycosyltransferase involved in cell wall biosynthesis